MCDPKPGVHLRAAGRWVSALTALTAQVQGARDASRNLFSQVNHETKGESFHIHLADKTSLVELRDGLRRGVADLDAALELFGEV